jgi:hypothetical protein
VRSFFSLNMMICRILLGASFHIIAIDICRLYDPTETAKWHNVRCKGELPTPRFGHSAVLVGSRMFVFGGKSDKETLRDVTFLDLVTWTWIPVSSTTAGPSPRCATGSI